MYSLTQLYFISLIKFHHFWLLPSTKFRTPFILTYIFKWREKCTYGCNEAVNIFAKGEVVTCQLSLLVTMKCSLRTVVLLSVWTFLLIWLYQAIIKLQKEETTFNHYSVENAFQWPVVNICPMYWNQSNWNYWKARNFSIESFEDVELEINRTRMHYIPIMLKEGANPDNIFSSKNVDQNFYLNRY